MAQYNAQMNTYLANEQAYEDEARRPPLSTWTRSTPWAAANHEGHPRRAGPVRPPTSRRRRRQHAAERPGRPARHADHARSCRRPRRDDELRQSRRPRQTAHDQSRDSIHQPPTPGRPAADDVVHPPSRAADLATADSPCRSHQPVHHPDQREWRDRQRRRLLAVDLRWARVRAVGTGSAGGAGGIGGPGMAAGGLAAGVPRVRPGCAARPASPVRTSGVKGIGADLAGLRTGSLSRGTTPGSAGARSTGAPRGSSIGGSRGAAGAKGATAGSRTAAGAGSRSASSSSSSAKAGTKARRSRGSVPRARPLGKGATKGKGLFRRGSNGSAAGTRGGRKKDDERTEQRDALVYEQDWLGDESAGTGVLD